jgi:metal-sulfur cluster biosynthetic enzyme
MDPTARPLVHATRTAELWRQLAGVTDPEMDESITDLRFIAALDIQGDDVTVEFRLPTYWCAANFAFMMAEDIRAQVSDLGWVRHVNVRLVDHYASEAINDGIAKGSSFTQTFPSETTDDLAELRRVFRRKAFKTRQEKLLRHLVRSGWSADALVCLSVRELRDADGLGADGEPLRNRYLEIRRELALPCEGSGRAITTVDGAPVALESFESYLRELRNCRVAMEANGHFCRGLLAVRYDLAAPGHQPAGVDVVIPQDHVPAGRHLPLTVIASDSRRMN